jgi:hypothetical protein
MFEGSRTITQSPRFAIRGESCAFKNKHKIPQGNATPSRKTARAEDPGTRALKKARAPYALRDDVIC